HVGVPLDGVELLQRAVQTGFSHQSLAVVRDAIAANLDTLSAPDWIERVVADVPVSLQNLVTDLAMAPLPERTEREVERYVPDVP
ncbi:hypothetical protein, partial [Mucilaginibacter sp. 5C4]|uniref:hypothetical protein n=1 Tax=Mucilaginibacter sp. 5C4 TaxID=3048589 RepID=UPI002B22E1EC